MKLAKKYFSILLVLLVCIPIADKAWDDYSHLQQSHCDDVSTHYCKAEHNCAVCDYVFSAPSNLPARIELQPLASSILINTSVPTCAPYTSPGKSLIQLRGPPTIA